MSIPPLDNFLEFRSDNDREDWQLSFDPETKEIYQTNPETKEEFLCEDEEIQAVCTVANSIKEINQELQLLKLATSPETLVIIEKLLTKLNLPKHASFLEIVNTLSQSIIVVPKQSPQFKPIPKTASGFPIRA